MPNTIKINNKVFSPFFFENLQNFLIFKQANLEGQLKLYFQTTLKRTLIISSKKFIIIF